MAMATKIESFCALESLSNRNREELKFELTGALSARRYFLIAIRTRFFTPSTIGAA